MFVMRLNSIFWAMLLSGAFADKFKFWQILDTPSSGTSFADICSAFGNIQLNSVGIADCGSTASVCEGSSAFFSCSGSGNSSTNSSLTDIKFSGASLYGFLPSSINNLISLTTLDLSSNSFYGTIPTEFGSSLSKLKSLNLASNSLSGMLPSSFCGLQYLTELKVGGNNKLVCYDSCYKSFGASLASQDFLTSLKECNPLYEDFIATPPIKSAWGTCTYPQNSKYVDSWIPRDYCTFYDLNNCANNACPPSCLSSSPVDYCYSFSYLSQACGPIDQGTLADIDVATNTCLDNFEASSPTLTYITFIFSFDLTNLDLALLWPVLADYDQLQVFVDAVITAFSASSSIPKTKITARNKGIEGFLPWTLLTEDTTGLGALNVKMRIDRIAAELFGPYIASPTAAAYVIRDRITQALSTSNGDSTFVKLLKKASGQLSLSLDESEMVVLEALSSLNLLSMSAIQSGVVTSTTSNTDPTFEDPVFEFARTFAPTSSPGGDPSSMPTPSPSSTTSSAPSDLPVAVPTAVPAIVPTSEPVDFPTPAPTSAPVYEAVGATCIRVETFDQFGDGWDSAHLLLVPSEGAQKSYSPTCQANPLVDTYCFDSEPLKDGAYAVLRMGGFDPARPWEVSWRVTNGYNGRTYYGDFDTVMIFVFREETVALREHGSTMSSWVELYHALNIVKMGEEVCDTCTNSMAISSFSKSQVLSGTDSPGSTVAFNYQSSFNDGAVGVFGHPQFFFSSSNEHVLLTSGTMCNTGSLDCAFKLPDGEYDLRVSGAVGHHDSQLAWSYCGLQGKQGYELLFTMEGGECVAKQLVSSVGLCMGGDDAAVVLTQSHIHGLLQLEGLGGAALSASEAEVVRQAIVQEFLDAHLVGSSLKDVSTSIAPLEDTLPKRRLDGSMPLRVAFKVNLAAVKFDGQAFKKYLDGSMSTGLFITRMRSMCASNGCGLAGLSRVSLLDLKVLHESVENKEVSIFASVVVGVCAVVGVFFGGIFLYSYSKSRVEINGYSRVDSSEHARGISP